MSKETRDQVGVAPADNAADPMQKAADVVKDAEALLKLLAEQLASTTAMMAEKAKALRMDTPEPRNPDADPAITVDRVNRRIVIDRETALRTNVPLDDSIKRAAEAIQFGLKLGLFMPRR
jgi:hypothetical protein